MSHTKILVVLPTLGDRLGTLAETLESVRAQAEQVDLSLTVVLPAAATEARELAERFGATIVEDPKKGISHAINLAVETATDETYYAWIGDDDLFRPQGLATLKALIESRPDAVLAYGGCDYIDEEGRLLFTNSAGRSAVWLLPWGPDLIPHPGSLIRIDAMHEVGLFDESLRFTMDLDLFLKLRSHGRFVSTRRSVSAFRWHSASMTVSDRSASTAEAEKVKRRHLPAPLRPISGVWHVPVRWAAARAARSVSRRAGRVAAGA